MPRIDLSEFDRVMEEETGTYYGRDSSDGKTDWYTRDGDLSFSSDTNYTYGDRPLEDWEKEESHERYEREHSYWDDEDDEY